MVVGDVDKQGVVDWKLYDNFIESTSEIRLQKTLSLHIRATIEIAIHDRKIP